MSRDAMDILNTIKDSSWTSYAMLSQRRNASQLALNYLVREGYVDAHGSKEWNKAYFRLTAKGQEALKAVSE